jgi:hypothetical protein
MVNRFMANGLRGVIKNLVRKTQKLYRVLIFAQLLIKQKLKEKTNKRTSFEEVISK